MEKKPLVSLVFTETFWPFNPFKPEFNIFIFIYYKPQIAVKKFRLVVDEDDLMWFKNCHVLVNQFHGNFHSKTPSCRNINSVSRDVK